MEDISKKIKTLEKELKILKNQKINMNKRIKIMNSNEHNLEKLKELNKISNSYLETKPYGSKKTYRELLEPSLIEKTKNIDFTYLLNYLNNQCINTIYLSLNKITNRLNLIDMEIKKLNAQNKYIFDRYKKNRDEIEFLDYESFSSDSD